MNGVRLTLIDVSFSVSDSNEKAISDVSYIICIAVHATPELAGIIGFGFCFIFSRIFNELNYR